MTKSTALGNGKQRKTSRRSAKRRTARRVRAVVWATTALVAGAAVVATFRSGNDAASAEKATFEEAKARAEAGDADGMRRLGYCYLNGIGVEASEEKAFEWTRKGAELGDPKATLALGCCYSFGWGVAVDKEAAIECYRRAEEPDAPPKGTDAPACLVCAN
ncbi:MAG: sel1 repeat family protein [Thermoguttaceae bacterium]|nr:sel1 repeat family protein [Thermoguttaceae bacterium]